ncbi:MAG TPA: ABC transporter ATP-binding protein [Bacteroidota bacterium]|jgi:ABC-2 type transport system ATP-binding protein|nr:ABC transporter ATP-binding protein [Bacteroidota bacterium]
MENVIQIKNLKKDFGDIKALQGINLTVNRGEMFGLVGPDGAGKTTLIRILCGIYKPTEGDANILGFNSIKGANKIKNKIGYLSQKFSLYSDLTVDENIEFFAEIHGVKDYKKRREELLEFTRLKQFRDRFADKLSGGMKQKLALACTLIHQPEIIFLDEPTTGVDPVSRRDFWKILSSLLNMNITIFLTTPYLDEVERCNRVAFLNKGLILKIDTPKKLKELIKYTIVEIIPSNVREAFKILNSSYIFEDIQAFGDRLNVFIKKYNIEYNILQEILEKGNIKILQNRIIQPNLENVFIHLIKKDIKS